jgi:5-hydroxyisourate hydrolase-like protein (transthyretin family)
MRVGTHVVGVYVPLKVKMKLPAFTVITAFLLCYAGGCPRGQAQSGGAAKNTATVSGKITIKGRPAPGVVVGLRVSQSAQPSTLTATTDQDGRYRIPNVSSGTYQVAPVAPAYVVADINKGWGQNLVISEGDNITGIDFDLVRGGVITGKVTDADGRPVVEEEVSLLAADYPRSGPSHVRGDFRTDDRGIYRMFGLRPGHYKVSIGEENLSVLHGSRSGRTIPITFYPDVNDAAKATIVEVDEGTEATNIDITLARASRTFSVSGRVVDRETDKPITNVAINLMKTLIIDAQSSSGFGGVTDVRTNANGEFTLEKLPAGKYSVSIQPTPESNLRAEAVDFDLVDEDVTGLVIKAASGGSLSGTVVLERTSEGNNVGPAPAWLSLYWRSEVAGTSYSSNQSTQIKPDGSFHVGGLTAGTIGFSVGAWSQFGDAKPIPVLRVERDGVVQPNGIQIQNGEHITGIRIIAAYSSGSIRGVVKLENGTLPPNGNLVVSVAKVGETAPNGGGIGVDARRRFLIEGLATGSYEVTVTAYAPEWRQGPRRIKQLVTVTDGAATDVMVTLDLTPKNP